METTQTEKITRVTMLKSQRVDHQAADGEFFVKSEKGPQKIGVVDRRTWELRKYIKRLNGRWLRTRSEEDR